MIPTKPYERTVRGPYFIDGTERTQRTEVANPSNYANHYNMVHLRKMFQLKKHSNNGRTDGGLK